MLNLDNADALSAASRSLNRALGDAQTAIAKAKAEKSQAHSSLATALRQCDILRAETQRLHFDAEFRESRLEKLRTERDFHHRKALTTKARLYVDRAKLRRLQEEAHDERISAIMDRAEIDTERGVLEAGQAKLKADKTSLSRAKASVTRERNSLAREKTNFALERARFATEKANFAFEKDCFMRERNRFIQDRSGARDAVVAIKRNAKVLERQLVFEEPPRKRQRVSSISTSVSELITGYASAWFSALNS
ncbi:hypothetical protein R3P38DRAFT_2985167 [Favolaschia claudopus]|uniref:Uncharacterized protein n=1 Tax=Favolaschia claudopus TaxID=2862362 RepID=A0AAW0AYR5_9AGAR